jgi:hypothetical protein
MTGECVPSASVGHRTGLLDVMRESRATWIEIPIIRLGTFLYTISCMHCMTVSLAQGGEGLGTMWGEEKTREYLQRAGFLSTMTHRLAHDIQNNWYVVMK